MSNNSDSEYCDPDFSLHNQDGISLGEIKVFSDRQLQPLESLIKCLRELKNKSNAMLTTLVEKEASEKQSSIDTKDNEDLKKNKRSKNEEYSKKKRLKLNS